MMTVDPIQLTRDLIRFETINPPGNETPCAEYIGAILEQAGFEIAYYLIDGDKNRANLIARIGGNGSKKPLCLCGHTDVVPLGAVPWSVPPFAAEMADGKIYGRGSTDMKSGDAALISAAVELAAYLTGTAGLVFVITAGEERGCTGANFLSTLDGVLGEAGALLVAEPTANRPLNGHKGVLWIEGRASGVTAHGSMPEQGENAVYKAARVIGKLEKLKLEQGRTFKAGLPTLNVGWFQGGMNINSIPDEAKFGLDVRIVPGLTDTDVLTTLGEIGSTDVTFEKLGYSDPVYTEPSNPWYLDVCEVMAEITGERHEAAIASYFSDASALTKAYGYPPAIILGPGEPRMAHQTDEYCYVRRIEEARAAYVEIIRRWCRV
jgi:succinyl-diaminopimelate desuccinylase